MKILVEREIAQFPADDDLPVRCAIWCPFLLSDDYCDPPALSCFLRLATKAEAVGECLEPGPNCPGDRAKIVIGIADPQPPQAGKEPE